MSIRTQQLTTAVLALTGLYVGVWAVAWPRPFYDAFPGLGHEWVSALGPYNEHLVRDVGGLYVALAIVSIWATARPAADTFAMVGLGWLGFDVPHLLFHLGHLEEYDDLDRVANTAGLVAVLLLAALLLVPTRPRTRS